ncbi:unnamed protein product [Prorocentrum cordatum]|uniref:Uncharacterized protein n=1 Tax=Prorocentrum cordatum TaxID=2364126 RepID=A0ABN9WNL3_9DINO|nr:unnamed protein product [Polarella glacialis]
MAHVNSARPGAAPSPSRQGHVDADWERIEKEETTLASNCVRQSGVLVALVVVIGAVLLPLFASKGCRAALAAADCWVWSLSAVLALGYFWLRSPPEEASSGPYLPLELDLTPRVRHLSLQGKGVPARDADSGTAAFMGCQRLTLEEDGSPSFQGSAASPQLGAFQQSPLHARSPFFSQAAHPFGLPSPSRSLSFPTESPSRRCKICESSGSDDPHPMLPDIFRPAYALLALAAAADGSAFSGIPGGPAGKAVRRDAAAATVAAEVLGTAGAMTAALAEESALLARTTTPTPKRTRMATPSPKARLLHMRGDATCADTSEETIGSNGGGCDWWTDYVQYCSYSFLYDDTDFTVAEMCCACGGGEATCADTWEEAMGSNGGGCDWWTDYAQYCSYSFLYDDTDFTVAEMCCACGGGEVVTTSAAETTVTFTTFTAAPFMPTPVPTPINTTMPTPVPTPNNTTMPTPLPTPISNTTMPTPVPTPINTTMPTPVPTHTSSTPMPTPVPTPINTTMPTPVPTHTSSTTMPTPVPTPINTTMPTPVPTLTSSTTMPTPVPTPINTTMPTPVPTLTSSTTMPTPVPTRMPVAVPTPVPTRMPTPVPTPMPTPSTVQLFYIRGDVSLQSEGTYAQVRSALQSAIAEALDISETDLAVAAALVSGRRLAAWAAEWQSVAEGAEAASNLLASASSLSADPSTLAESLEASFTAAGLAFDGASLSVGEPSMETGSHLAP